MIKEPILFYFSLALLLVSLGFVIERLLFLRKAERVTGIVSQISGTNGTCGSGGKGAMYDCTKYNAMIDFTSLRYERGVLTVSAGSSSGHDRPVSGACKRVNQQVPVVYDPNNLSKAYEATLFGMWGIPLWLFVVHVATLVGSLGKRYPGDWH